MLTFDLINEEAGSSAVIKVVGVGGAGGNAVSHMVTTGLDGVEFICADTDNQKLQARNVTNRIALGGDVTNGLGAGMVPDVGRTAAESAEQAIAEQLRGANMVFIAAGLGGGTGTGAAPVVAKVAKELGILTVAVVTKPFGFEGGKRMSLAQGGQNALLEHVDSLITIPNDKLPEVFGNDFPMLNAFAAANDVLKNAVQGISELITKPGLINVDFADVRTVMSEAGTAMMGAGVSSNMGTRAKDATNEAIASPLLEDTDLRGARGILIHVAAGENITMGEVQEVGNIVREIAADDANIIFGNVVSPELGDEFRVTVVATGLGVEEMALPEPMPTMQTTSAAASVAMTSPTASTAPEPAVEVVNETNLRQVRKVPVPTGSEAIDFNSELFDAPAFLRHQND